jgi:branched-chain amino acid transport system permease protein
MAFKTVGLSFLGIFLLILPLSFGDYYVHLATMVLFYAFLGLAWNILGGYAGQFSFGHAAFFGIGVFTSSLLQIHAGVNPWIGMIFSGLGGLLLGLFIGYLCFRYGLRGPYFALAILSIAEMLRLLAVQVMTQKYPLGISIPMQGDSLLLFQFGNKIPYYYIILVMMVAVLYLTHRIEQHRIGMYFKAIRENETAAESLGIPTFRYKMLAMGISCFLTALGGTFYAQYYLIVEEEAAFSSATSVEILLGPIIGGPGTVFGPLVGSFILEGVSELSRNLLGGHSGANLIVYGIILILVVLFLPHGILSGLQSALKKYTTKKAENTSGHIGSE